MKCLSLTATRFLPHVLVAVIFLLLFLHSSHASDYNINNMVNNPLNNQINRIGKGSVGYTGDMSFEIPLMTVPGRGGLDFNLIASYKAGIRADQEASIIGLGWHLETGEIIRNIRLYHDLLFGLRTGTELGDIPDAFSMSTPFGSMRFSNFQADTGSTFSQWFKPFSDPLFYSDNWAPWKIEIFHHKYDPNNSNNYSYVVDGFRIVDEDGTQYIFRKPLYRESIAATPVYNDIQDVEFGNYKWMLTAALSYDYVDDVGSADPYDPLDSDHPATDNTGNWIAIKYRFDANQETDTLHYKYPNYLDSCAVELTYAYRIVTSTHVAEFTYEDEVPAGYESYKSAYEVDNRREKRLTRIVLYKYSGTGSEPSSSGDWFQKVDFTYRDDEELQLAPPVPGIGMANMNFGKTTLEGITILTKASTENLDYAFEYDFNPYLHYTAEGDSIDRDPWNYFNDPNVYGSSEDSCASAWSLTKLTLPSGGWTEYEYENDRWYYGGLKKEGGVRLARKKVYDGIHATPAVYTYSYGDNANHYGYESSIPGERIRLDHELYGQNDFFYFGDDGNDHYIGYDLVTEVMPDSHIVKRYYTTTNDTDVNRDVEILRNFSWHQGRTYYLVYYAGSYDFQRGLLRKEVYFKQDGATKIRQVQYDYSYQNSLAILHQISSIFNPETYPQSISAWVKKNSATAFDYFYNGADSVMTTVTFAYDTLNGKVNKTIETNSDSTQRIMDIEYAYGSYPVMVETNMLSQVKSTSIKDNQDLYYSKEFTEWAAGHARISRKWKWKSDIPATTTTNNFLVFENPHYDDYGNLQQFTNARGVITTTKWGHNHSVPIATIVNAEDDECFVEDFDDHEMDDGEPADWYTTGSYWTAEDGYLYWTTTGSSGMCANSQALDLENFIAEFDITVVDGYLSGSGGGFQFRKSDYQDDAATSGYFLCLTENNQLLLWVEEDVLDSYQLNETAGNWHHIKVLAEGTTIQVFADGVLAMDVDDDLYEGQYVGFEIDRAETEFDNLRIYPPDAQCTSQSHDFVTLRPCAETDENGMTRYYEYDGLGRLKSISNSDFATLSEYNYFYSWDGTNSFDPADPNYVQEKVYRTTSDYTVTKTYSDGLARNIQIQQQDSTKDINISMDYDPLGRVSKTWKPYCCTSSHNYEDDFDASATNLHSAKYYYDGTHGGAECGDYPFSASVYRDEFSDKLAEVSFPGETFATPGGHTVTYQYLTGTSTDSCGYPNHSLLKTRVKDENGNYSTSFVDKFGNRVISWQLPAGGPLPYEELRLDVEASDTGLSVESQEFTVDHPQYVNYHYRLELQGSGWARFTIFENGSAFCNYIISDIDTVEDTEEFEANPGNTYKIEAKISPSGGVRSSRDFILYYKTNLIKTVFQYDILGNLLKTIDPADKESQNKYNTLGQLIAKTSPDLDGNGDGDPADETIGYPDERYIYDENGNLRYYQTAEQRASGTGDFIVYAYDTFDRVVLIGEENDYHWTSLAPSLTGGYGTDADEWKVKYTYDKNMVSGAENYSMGRLTQTQINEDGDNDAEHQFQYVYDKFGNISEKHFTIDVGENSEKIIRYEYNLQGQVIEIEYPSGNTILQTYDHLGRIKEIIAIQ